MGAHERRQRLRGQWTEADGGAPAWLAPHEDTWPFVPTDRTSRLGDTLPRGTACGRAAVAIGNVGIAIEPSKSPRGGEATGHPQGPPPE